MRLPHADAAVIDGDKLRSYLLSPTHPVGRFKARFFGRLGYRADDWKRLEADLRSQHLQHAAHPREKTAYGQKYEIRGRLVGPNGTAVELVSAWIIRAGEEAPRFVTAYPGGMR